MSGTKAKYRKATPEELKLIEELTTRSVVERIEAGEAEIVDEFDWSDVPQLPEGEEAEDSTVTLSKRLYRKLRTESKKRKTTPDRLARKWISKCLENARKED